MCKQRDKLHLERFRQDSLVAAYEVLASRYASTTQFQWQVPAFGLVSEGALLSGIVSAHTAPVRYALAGVAVIVAIIVPAITRRAELTAWWDRGMLDEYESILLPTPLRLHHNLNLKGRMAHREANFNMSKLRRKIELGIVMCAPPSLILAFALVMLAAAGMGIAILNS